MRRWPIATSALLTLALAAPAAAQDDEGRLSEMLGSLGYYARDTGNQYAIGLNGLLTWPADPVMMSAEGDEVFPDLWLAPVTGRVLGFGAGLLQGLHRAFMGVTDFVFAPMPWMYTVSPVPRFKLLPLNHPDE